MASLKKKKISEQNVSEEGDSGTRGRSPAWRETGASAPGERGKWGDSHQAGVPGSQDTVPQRPEEE